MKTLFHAHALDIAVGGRMLARGLEFFLSAGELLMMTGPNGAGKSTLMRVLAGLVPPCHGEFVQQSEAGIWQNIMWMPSRRRARTIACAGQNIPDNIPCSVEDMVMLGRSPWQNMFGRCTVEDKRICLQAMEQMDVLHLARTPWRTLSGGERQRVLVARALCQTPQLLLLDEPTSALDYRHQQQLMELLRDQCRKGLCVIMITHDLNLAALYADKVLLMGDGVTFQGTPSSVFVPDILEQVYHCRLLVDVHPCGSPRISLMRERS